ncbi:unnamed protein product, partial [Coregonus sp. 'balchen']
MSSAVTVSVSNSNTTNLPQPVNLTFNHLQSSDVDPTCVYWSDENGPGEWSGRGCTSVMSNSTHTRSGQLSVVMWVGISVALAFVVLSLITILWCRNFSRKRRGGHRLQHDKPNYCTWVKSNIDECSNNSLICGDNSACFNTVGSYYCECLTGFKDFAGATRQCLDIDECAENQHICGEWDICLNQVGSYQCKCPTGFSNYNYRRTHCVDINECNTEGVCGKGGNCHNLNGSYWCLCSAGFTNFGNNQTKCVELNCDQYETQPGQSNGEVTKLLRTIEMSIRLIAPLLTENVTRIETNHTKAEIMVRRDKTPPEGPVSLTNENTQLDTTWETAVGDYQNYPGFAFVVLLSYKNLDTLKDSFSHQSQQLMSSAVTVSVSNSNTTNLPHPVNLTFNHLQRSGQLSVVMWVGISVALAFVVLSLITILWCRNFSRKRHIDECAENQHICGEWDICLNQVGSYQCKCPTGFSNYNYRRTHCVDINECNTEGVCGKGGICHNLNGSYWCLCSAGFTNFGNNQTKCVELNCDQYETQPGQTLPGFDSFVSLLRNNCLVLSNSTLPGPSRQLLTANVLLTLLVNTTDVLHLGVQSNGEVTKLLRTIEMSIRLIAPLLTENVTRIETNHTKVEIMVRRDKTPPEGPVSLTNENTQLDTTWETAVGDYQNYPGFAFVVLLSYKNLDTLKDSFSPQSQQLMSSAVTVSVSNSNTTNLPQPVNLTFNHLQSSDVDPTCVYWSDENGPGEWSGRGCTSRSGQLSVVMWVGISVALAFVVLSLIMSLWCRNFSRKRRGGHRLQHDVQLHSK